MAGMQKPTYFYATMSTSIVLVLISIFLLLFFHSRQISNIVRENLLIVVELEEQLPLAQVDIIRKNIGGTEGVKPGSVKFVSRESALVTMSKELNLSKMDGENPFRDVVTFNLLSNYYSDSKLQDIKKTFELEKGVTGVYYENDNVSAVKANLDKIAFGILILALCFVVLAVAIIFNTIKLSLYSDQKLIQTMQMVGADDTFIKKPYLQAAFWMALKASGAVIICIILLCAGLLQSGSVFGEIIQWHWVALTILICILAAFVIQFSATIRIINVYLRTQSQL